MSSLSSPFMQAWLWTCKTCGFVLEGGQPMYECALCESYKTSFINIPQHLEKQVREEHAELPINHTTCRDRRLELMNEFSADGKRLAAGRVLPAASGNHMNPSSD